MSGEHRIEVSADYLVECVGRLRGFVPSISLETQTWSDDTYSRLVAAGLEACVHYQETYDRERYAEVHVAGWKRDFDRRLSSIERAAAAGVRRLGIGALLGLSCGLAAGRACAGGARGVPAPAVLAYRSHRGVAEDKAVRLRVPAGRAR